MSGPIIFGATEIRERVTMALAIESARRAFTMLTRGAVQSPYPWHLDVLDAGGEVHVKGASVRASERFAVKTSTGFPSNAQRNLPTSDGYTAVFAAETGALQGLLLDGGYLTELRTGAASALALDLLAPEQIGTVAVIGTGGQARFQLQGLRAVRSPRHLVISGRRVEQARDLARWAAVLGFEDVRWTADIEAAVKEADAVLSVTSARWPVIDANWLTGRSYVASVGSDSPGKKELDPTILRSAALVVVDDIEQSRTLGELQGIAADDLKGPLITLGAVIEAREFLRPDGLTVVDLSGTGAQDAAIADAAWAVLTGEATSAER